MPWASLRYGSHTKPKNSGLMPAGVGAIRISWSVSLPGSKADSIWVMSACSAWSNSAIWAFDRHGGFLRPGGVHAFLLQAPGRFHGGPQTPGRGGADGLAAEEGPEDGRPEGDGGFHLLGGKLFLFPRRGLLRPHQPVLQCRELAGVTAPQLFHLEVALLPAGLGQPGDELGLGFLRPRGEAEARRAHQPQGAVLAHPAHQVLAPRLIGLGLLRLRRKLGEGGTGCGFGRELGRV